MRLHNLLSELALTAPLPADFPDLEVLGVQEDSRLVTTGDVFVARAGTRTDGAKFVAQAHQRGAVAVLAETPLPDCPLPQVQVPNASAAAGLLAHAVLNHPSRAMRVVGVTGTNGKTTTAYIVRHLLASANLRCGLIGTVAIDDGRTNLPASMTTPGGVELAQIMATMRDRGCRAVAMEVSSHALHQHRTAGVNFAAAGFTNLTGDHLDYHGTMDAYRDAKAMLFDALPPDAVAVANTDDPAGDRMLERTAARTVRLGMSPSGETIPGGWRADDLVVTSDATCFRLTSPAGAADVRMKLLGRHNVQNALVAAAMVGEAFGHTPQQLAEALATAAGAPGRLQRVEAGQPYTVLVDYAHTDDALENVLSALAPICRGTLRVVFGCGGDRDRTKRPRMARVAEKWAGAVYVTSDNPRTEDPQAILDEICLGFETNRPRYVHVDRRTAIQTALADAGEQDIVLIAGKGHEDYQIVGTTKHHFDDVEEARRAIEAAGARAA